MSIELNNISFSLHDVYLERIDTFSSLFFPN